jgi:MraZ protein
VSFRGENIHNLDDKFRIIIPSAFRDELNGKGVLTRGWNGCLFLYPADKFDAIEAELFSQPMLNQEAMDLKRWFIGSAEDVNIDAQGRMTVPERLRPLARIYKEVVSVGTGDKIELWGREAWDDYTRQQSQERLTQAAIATGLGRLTS